MGITDSRLTPVEGSADEITKVTDKSEQVDHHLEKLKRLAISPPVLRSVPVDSILKDMLVRRPSFQTHDDKLGSLDPTTTASLLTLYQEWQRVTSEKINKNQDDLGDKIGVVEALAVKLLQRFNFSLCLMKTNGAQLEDVHAIKMEVGEMKGKLREVLENYNGLHQRIEAEGPEFLKSSAKPVSLTRKDFSVRKASGSSSLL